VGRWWWGEGAAHSAAAHSSESKETPAVTYEVLLRKQSPTMFTSLSAMNSSLTSYATEYTETRAAYLLAAKNLKEATGPYKATRDAYVAATATYTKSLYE